MNVNKKQMSEQDIRTKYITPAILAAGWDRDLQIREEVSFTKGKITVRRKTVKRGEQKRADYILYWKPNIPLAIVEAKANNHNIADGMEQALNYAEILDIPFVFTSNGDRFSFYDKTAEHILKDLQSAGNSGEYYTPRPVTQFMVDMVNPQLGEQVLDFACGTGGFLVCALEHLRKQVRNIDDEAQLQNSILGVEKKPLPHMLCTTNLILHNIDNPQIKHDNSLGYPVKDIKPKDKVDIILTNPPFGGIEEDGIEDNFPANYKTKETADLFLVLLMYKLNQTGRAAIVLPDGFLFGEGVKTAIKEKLLREFNLHTIVRLPNGVFAPYTGINTNLLFLERGTTHEIWFYEHQLPEGYKNYTKTKPIKLDEFEAEKAWWSARKETDCAWKVSIDEVKARGYNLDFKNPSTQLEQSIPSPEEVISKVSDCLTRSRQILLEIEELLK